MVVRIRLARFGKRHQPVYNIVVAQQKSGSKRKPMEVLGTYDPIPKTPLPGEGTDITRQYKDIRLDTPRAKYWLGVGAQPSDTVWRLFSMLGLVERKFREVELQRRAREADERHRAYWEVQAAKREGTTATSKQEQASKTAVS